MFGSSLAIGAVESGGGIAWVPDGETLAAADADADVDALAAGAASAVPQSSDVAKAKSSARVIADAIGETWR